MNIWNITGSQFNLEQFKRSKYFLVELGMSNTVKGAGDSRKLREGQFTSWYYNQNKSLIFKIGKIASIHFYIDHYLVNKELIGFFMHGNEDKHQYAITWEQEYVDKHGIDAYLSKLLKEVDDTVDSTDFPEKSNEKVTKDGEGDNVVISPGSATWEDIAQYIKNKKSSS